MSSADIGCAEFCAQTWYVENELIALIPCSEMGMLDAPMPAAAIAKNIGCPAIYIPPAKFDVLTDGVEPMGSFLANTNFYCPPSFFHK